MPVFRRAAPLVASATLLLAVGAACSTDASGTDGATVTTKATPLTTVAPTPTTGPSADPGGEAMRWVALGDSFSAGQGGSGPTVDAAPRCPRAEADSYARRAATMVAADPTPGGAVELEVVACGGALIEDVVRTQAPQAVGADIATLTVGGNDAGFFALTSQCLSTDGCPDLTADDADLALVDDAGDGRTDWQVLQDDLAAAYRTILNGMAPGGRLFVLTYPLPFPERPGACPTGFGFVEGGAAGLVNAVITRLDATITAAAADAGEGATEGRRIEVLDWRTPTGAPAPVGITVPGGRVVPSGWNPAGICGVDPMLNGLRFDAEVGDSFHPSDRGLDLAAVLVADALRRTN